MARSADGARRTADPRALPGARPAGRADLLMAAAGSLVLVGAETAGELTLGLMAQQSKMTVLFAVFTLAAAFLEALIFRGYLVITHRGRATLVAGILLASAPFAALHPSFWAWAGSGHRFTPGPKAWFTTAALFVGSLWFYALRFLPANRTDSCCLHRRPPHQEPRRVRRKIRARICQRWWKAAPHTGRQQKGPACTAGPKV